MPDERKDLTAPPERIAPYTPEEAESFRKVLEGIGSLEQSSNSQIAMMAVFVRNAYMGLDALHDRMFDAERKISRLEEWHRALLETIHAINESVDEEREALGIKLADLIDDEGRARRNDVVDLERRIGNCEDDVAKINR
jgi:hypothetical protein